MGNALALDPFKPLDLQTDGTQNLTSLEGKVDVSKYLTGTSDIVALMTLEHQVGVANRINAINYQYKRTKGDGMSPADWALIDIDIDDLTGYLLFVDEAPLDEAVKACRPSPAPSAPAAPVTPLAARPATSTCGRGCSGIGCRT